MAKQKEIKREGLIRKSLGVCKKAQKPNMALHWGRGQHRGGGVCSLCRGLAFTEGSVEAQILIVVNS